MLQNGDHLTRDEFERRWDAMPELDRAELIEGVVFMPSPVRHLQHSRPNLLVICWLNAYERATPGVTTSLGCSVRIDPDNMPQPDGLLMIDPARGGQARIEDGYIAGSPELLAEISASTVSLDLHAKFNVYQRARVQEYVVCRVQDRAVDWFALEGDAYRRLAADDAGVYRSVVFPGLWLDTRALMSDDQAGLMATLAMGIETPEHAAFAARLRR